MLRISPSAISVFLKGRITKAMGDSPFSFFLRRVKMLLITLFGEGIWYLMAEAGIAC